MNDSTQGPKSSSRIQVSTYSRTVRVWLIIGLVMIFFQIIIGGITRLTGSGLSITKWEIVTGTIPPLNDAQWIEAFDLYKATPQYQKINEGMDMGAFKFIYFWEYFHRLWARLMGFVFLIPFLFFLAKGRLKGPLFRKLVVVFLLAALVASFGWIMVASGLINRPWVNAYKLTMHLSLAIILFGYLLWTTLQTWFPFKWNIESRALYRLGLLLITVLGLQIILGGIMSGMKAALFYPTWPSMNGDFLPGVLLDRSMWTYENFIAYDKTPFMSAIIQFLHRNTAYLLIVIVGFFSVRGIKTWKFDFQKQIGPIGLLAVAFIQVLLGIGTLIGSKGVVPVGLGVMHQAGAIILLTFALYSLYFCTHTSESKEI